MTKHTCTSCFSEVTTESGVLVPSGWWGGNDGKGPLRCAACAGSEGWIGVDWDGTMVEYFGWLGQGQYGPPIPLMVNRVKKWLADGMLVKVVTARAADPFEVRAIGKRCEEIFGVALPVTDRKDYRMIEIWDDRAVRVETNTGRRIR